MTIQLETCMLYIGRSISRRMDIKLNPGLEAVYLYCSNGVAVLLLGPASCSLRSTALNTVWWILQALLSFTMAMRTRSQPVEDEKSRQEQGTDPRYS